MAGFNRLRTHDQTSLLLFANILKLVLLIDFYFLTNNIKHVNLAEFLRRAKDGPEYSHREPGFWSPRWRCSKFSIADK